MVSWTNLDIFIMLDSDKQFSDTFNSDSDLPDITDIAEKQNYEIL